MAKADLHQGKFIVPLTKADRRRMAGPRLVIWGVPLLFAVFALLAQLIIFKDSASDSQLSWILWIGVPPTFIAALWFNFDLWLGTKIRLVGPVESRPSWRMGSFIEVGTIRKKFFSVKIAGSGVALSREVLERLPENTTLVVERTRLSAQLLYAGLTLPPAEAEGEQVHIRPATGKDAAYLRYLLRSELLPSKAADPGSPAPALPHAEEGWGRPGDFGYIALDHTNSPVAAAWIRRADPGKAHAQLLDEHSPVLCIAVDPSYRNRGIGTDLIIRLTKAARQAGHRSLSAVADRHSPAQLWLEHKGFVINDSAHPPAGKDMVVMRLVL